MRKNKRCNRNNRSVTSILTRRGYTKKWIGIVLLNVIIVCVTFVTSIYLYNIYTSSRVIQCSACVCGRVRARVPAHKKTGVTGVTAVTISEVMGKQGSEATLPSALNGYTERLRGLH
jgi:hypothetical protein